MCFSFPEQIQNISVYDCYLKNESLAFYSCPNSEVQYGFYPTHLNLDTTFSTLKVACHPTRTKVVLQKNYRLLDFQFNYN